MSATEDLLVRHKLDADEYFRMAEAGILDEDSQVELIDGEILDMAPIGQDHMATVNGLNEALVLSAAGRAIVSVQNSLRLDRRNVPEPDFAILRPRADRYRTGERAGPADVLLIIEVADSSLRFDRAVKLPLYARTGIPEVWIVDLQSRVVETHRRPEQGAYAETATHTPDAVLALALAPDIAVKLSAAFD